MLNEKQARATAADVLKAVRKGAAGAEATVWLTSGRSANTRFARNEITSTGDVEETAITVELAFGKRHASASTNQTDADTLSDLVARLKRMTEAAPEDPEYMPVLGPQRYAKSPKAFDDRTAKLVADVRAEAARAALEAGKGQNVTGAGFFTHRGGASAMATSAGLFAYHEQTSVEFTCTARTADGTGSGWAGAWSHRAGDVDAPALARVAIEKGVRSAKPKRLEPGRYQVVLEPAAVQDLLSFLISALSARSADEGRSFMAKPAGGTKLGEKLFPDTITLRSDPTAASTPGPTWDRSGIPLEPITWIDAGKIAALSYPRYWAAKQGKEPTGSHSRYELAGGNAPSVADLVKGVKRGVLITRLWYLRWVDPQSILVTGLTRDGVFLIENGEVAHPVNNFRFNESPVVMLKNADAMTKETWLIQNTRVPAIRTDGFNLASVSEAV